MLYKLLDGNSDDTIKNNFSDLKNHWALNQINYLFKNKFINGYDADKFMPDEKLTRAQAAQVLYNILSKKNEELGDIKLQFNDLSNCFAKNAIEYLASHGVINGYGNKFLPDNYISRAEVVTILSKAFNRSINWNGENEFKDVKNDYWAYKFIMNAANGI